MHTKVLSIPFLLFAVLALTGRDIRSADYGTGYQTGYLVEISKPHEVFTFTTSGEKEIGPGMIAQVQLDLSGTVNVQLLMNGQAFLSCNSKARSFKIYVAQKMGQGCLQRLISASIR